MGLFSTKKKHYVGTTVVRVVEDQNLPNSPMVGMQRALLRDQMDQLSDHVREALSESVALRASRMYNYAKQHYTYGVPSGRFTSDMDGLEQVQTVLTALEGAPVMIEYSHLGPANILHIGWMKLLQNHQYNPATNQLPLLASPEGLPVYLEDMTVVVPVYSADTNNDGVLEPVGIHGYEDGALDQWGISPKAGWTPQRKETWRMAPKVGYSPVEEENVATERVRVTYCWQRKAKPKPWHVKASEWIPTYYPYQGEFYIPITGYDDNADYFHVKYTIGGITKYWLYEKGEGIYPILDTFNEAKENDVDGQFYPFAYFRFNKTREDADPNSAAYQTSEKLLQYLGISYQMIIDEVHNQENTDIGDLEQAMLMMGVPANTTNEKEQRYLYEFFDAMYYSKGNQKTSETAAKIAARFASNNVVDARPPKISITIQDRRFTMVLSNGGVYKSRRTGRLGKIGSFHSGTDSATHTETYRARVGDNEPARYEDRTRTVVTKYHYYRKQVAENLFDELRVVNLQMKYQVWGKYWTTGDETDEILLIPISRTLTESWAIPDRERLYSRSLHFVFNSHVVVKIKWYQQGIFKAFMAIIAIVLVIFQQYWAVSMYLAMQGTVMTMVLFMELVVLPVLMQMAMTMAITMAVVNVAKAISPKLAIIVAVAAIIYAGYQANTNTTGLQTPTGIPGLPTAKDLLQLSMNVVKTSMDGYTADKMDALSTEIKEFQDLAKTKTKELEELNNQLGADNHLEPLVIFGETPTEYYNRTIHSGNIGVLGIEAVTSYVDIALALPRLNDTMRGFA